MCYLIVSFFVCDDLQVVEIRCIVPKLISNIFLLYFFQMSSRKMIHFLVKVFQEITCFPHCKRRNFKIFLNIPFEFALELIIKKLNGQGEKS